MYDSDNSNADWGDKFRDLHDFCQFTKKIFYPNV